MEMNPTYAKAIELVPNPLWSVSGLDLFIEGNGPATRVASQSDDPAATKIKALCIDDLVQQRCLNRLDFIKMDIEGAEMHALIGAEKSIRRFCPKLAIAVYHRTQDLWEIPEWLDKLDLGYRFYLRHFTIHQEETVLFAQAGVQSSQAG